MNIAIDTSTVVGIIASVMTFISFLCRNMLWLRLLGIVSNLLFIAYGYMSAVLPTLVLNCLLLLLNSGRLFEILRLTKTIATADQTTPLSKWLLPHMRRRDVPAGTVLFRRGERADSIIYAARGELQLQEIGKSIKTGELIGEIGLFSPEKARTQTLTAVTDCTIYELSDEALYGLYFQNPRMGFHVVRLIVERLLTDLRRQHPLSAETVTKPGES